MYSWIISVVGIALLTILCDVILPDGKLNKHVKHVCSLLAVAVVFSPVLSMLRDFSIDIDVSQEALSYDVNLENYFVVQTVEDIENTIEQRLDSAGFVGATVEISYHVVDAKLILEKAVVSLKNVVLSSPSLVINLNENIKKIILDLYSFEQGVIVLE